MPHQFFFFFVLQFEAVDKDDKYINQLDLSKAFDIPPHQRLIPKLKADGKVLD